MTLYGSPGSTLNPVCGLVFVPSLAVISYGPAVVLTRSPVNVAVPSASVLTVPVGLEPSPWY